LFEFIKCRLGYEHHFLAEHINNGLPSKEATLNFLNALGADTFYVPNGKLSNWLPMMMTLYYLDTYFKRLANLINSFYNENYYRMDNCEPCYRYLIVASKKVLAQSTIGEFRKLIASDNKGSYLDFSPVLALVELFNLDLLNERQKRICQLEEDIRNLENDREIWRAHAEGLENDRDTWRKQAGALENDRDTWRKQAGALENDRDAWRKQAGALENDRDTWRKQAGALENDRDTWRSQAGSLEEDRDTWRKQGEALRATRMFKVYEKLNKIMNIFRK
jgi:hypothetical protein